ncbi:unnamed protein product [Effrenium voratum]|nr:unnamed protein product [Effrenium voratum]
MASDSSEESEAKRPVDALDVRVLSVAGEVLLRLSARRDWKLTRLKEFLEAALKMPKLTQRLLHGQEVLEDQSVLGSCVQDCDPRLDLTLVRQKPPVDSLMQQAMLGNGSSCLTLLQLPEALELVNFTEEMSPLSCLQAAALMRLNATCLEILKMPGFRLVNQADILRRRQRCTKQWTRTCRRSAAPF